MTAIFGIWTSVKPVAHGAAQPETTSTADSTKPEVRIVSHKDVSQYRAGGVSACGVASLNCARIIFEKCQTLPDGDSLVAELGKRETMEEIMVICTQWSSTAHLDVDTDIFRVPIFQRVMKRSSSMYMKPTEETFRKMLKELDKQSDPTLPAVVVITRPPEIISCFKIPTSDGIMYGTFDSHPRPSHPDGAAFVLSKSTDQIVSHLTSLLAVDSSLLSDLGGLQWQAQLLSNCSGHFFHPLAVQSLAPEISQLLTEASLEILSTRARVTEMESRISALEAINTTTEADVDRLQATLRRQGKIIEDQLCRRCSIPVRSQEHKIGPRERNDGAGQPRSPTTTKPPDPSPSWTVVARSRRPPAADLEFDYMEIDGVPIAELDLNKHIKQHQALKSTLSKQDLAKESGASRKDASAVPVGGKEKVKDAAPPSTARSEDARRDGDLLLAQQLQMRYDHDQFDYMEIDGVPIAELNLKDRSGPSGKAHHSQDSKPERPPAVHAQDAAKKTRGKEKAKDVFVLPPARRRSPTRTRPFDVPDDELQLARQIQMQYDLSLPRDSTAGHSGQKHLHRRPLNNRASLPHSTGRSITPNNPSDNDRDLVRRLQQEYDDEDVYLQKQRQTLEKSNPATFECGVCLEDFPEDYLAKIEPCGHSFCRACIKRYVEGKIKEQKFPFFCPSCTAGDGGQSAITSEFIQMLGISEKEFRQLEELQLAAFSILLHCRKCKQGAFADRSEYQAAKIIGCPLPGCNYVWCKDCSQAVDVGGPRHSCDGSSELNHLMKEKGWKYCPGCQTPIQRDSGCNHMTCMSPGCHAHFCYICGELIVKSQSQKTIKAAVGSHYQRCSLFDVPRDLS